MPLPPLVEPIAQLSAAESERTSRHAILAGFGDVAQRRLAAAHVAVVGAGGIGSPVVLALASAGIGTLTVIDDDEVEASNLQRQILHRRVDVGSPKVDSASRAAGDLSETTVITRAVRLDAANATALLSAVDVVVDGSDTFDTREIVAGACEQLGLPLVWGVVQEFHAQATIFWSHPPVGVAPVVLRDLYPSESVGTAPTCAQVGVLGSLCMQVGALLSTETIKLITGVGDPILGRVIVIDALRGRSSEIPLRGAAATPGVTVDSVTQDNSRPGPPRVERRTIGDGATVLDVREPAETATGVIGGSVVVPLGAVLADPSAAGDGPFIVVCAAGVRAERAARALIASGREASVLSGGIDAWVAGGGALSRVDDRTAVSA